MKIKKFCVGIMKQRSLLYALLILLALPPVSTWVESTMLTHMLIHIPAWILVGWFLGEKVISKNQRLKKSVYVFRWAFLVLASATVTIWMIPRLLDLAFTEFEVDVAKVTSLTFLAGLPLRLAWVNFGPVARGIYLVEVLASFWRLGWIYLTSPNRLCNQYGLDDQISLGYALLFAGTLMAIWMIWKVTLNTLPEDRLLID